MKKRQYTITLTYDETEEVEYWKDREFFEKITKSKKQYRKAIRILRGIIDKILLILK